MLFNIHNLPQRRVTDITLLEIAGYPHLENVASNIFAFYFQSTNLHSYHSLLLRAIMSFFHIDITSDVVVDAHREDVTSESKRIDIVIETEILVLGIENKIYHHLSNDLGSYWSHLQGLADGRSVYGVVLSLHATTMPLNEVHFVNITYGELFDRITIFLQNEQNSLPNKYDLFFQDFQQTMQTLSRGTAMDDERLAFFRQHQHEIRILLEEVQHVRGEMRRKLKSLAAILSVQDSFPGISVRPGTWSSGTETKEFLNYAFDLQNKTSLQIDIFLDSNGWGMQFFNQHGDKNKIREWIDQRQIRYHVQLKPIWRLLLVMDEPIPYEADIGQVYDWAMDVLHRIMPSRDN